jgi:small subunit ribosomal protein S16
MLKIRLARVGKKKRPAYRLIVSEASRDTFGKALEILGHFNPFTKVIEVKKDRILYWISQGAKPSPTVHNILIDQNVITGEKVKASKGRKREQKKEKPVEKPKDEAKVERKVEEKKEEAKKEEEKKPKAEVKPEDKKDEVKEEKSKPEAKVEKKEEEKK